ncbi:MAG: alpha-2-macroglobulin, partial [Giesbergeria sp.]
VDKRFEYTVRDAFTAELSCERENAQAACLPILPMTVTFSASVPWKLASAIRLRGPHESVKPVFSGDDETTVAQGDTLVTTVRFAAPFAEATAYSLELPKDFVDDSGRTLANATMFPLAVSTGTMPPLAKFAAAPFGIVERFAEGPDGPALLPITLRKVESALQLQALGPETTKGGAQMSTLTPQSDADIIAWYLRVQSYNRSEVKRKDAKANTRVALPKPLKDDDKNYVQSRMVSLLGGQPGVRSVTLPKADAADRRPFEVVGVPLSPGFHVLEVASPVLGAALLASEYGAGRTMYVRTSTLVTNLAVHFKLGREDALAWVTSLDKGKVVAGAKVQVSDCKGRLLAEATTDSEGRAAIKGLPASAPSCSDSEDDYASTDGYFVSARHTDDDGVADMAFTWSEWQRGIEPWRFNVPTSSEAERDQRAHT